MLIFLTIQYHRLCREFDLENRTVGEYNIVSKLIILLIKYNHNFFLFYFSSNSANIRSYSISNTNELVNSKNPQIFNSWF